MAAESEIQDFLNKAGAAVEAGYNAVMQGGEVQAFFRQGIGELGNALQAFPNSIQHEEPGAIFSPLHSDIADSRQAYGPSPADLGGGQELSKQQADTPQVSPADLTESNTTAAQQQGQQQTQSRGISM